MIDRYNIHRTEIGLSQAGLAQTNCMFVRNPSNIQTLEILTHNKLFKNLKKIYLHKNLFDIKVKKAFGQNAFFMTNSKPKLCKFYAKFWQ